MRFNESITRNGDGLLKVPEAAALLGMRPASIRAWILRRQIPVVRLSARCLRIRRQDVERIIADRFIPAKPDAKLAKTVTKTEVRAAGAGVSH
jgi:predicted DNA-binding transcriptional regulator AlpA